MPNLRITSSFRPDAVKHKHSQGASKKNPGGGLARKAEQLSLALPTLEFVDISEAGDIHITEQLWFSGKSSDAGTTIGERIEAYIACPAYKILWTSDLEGLRWNGSEMTAVFDASDVVACNSEYMKNLLSAYADPSKLAVLTDPIDPNWVFPGQKQKTVYGCSQVILEKGIADVVSLFDGLQGVMHRLFLGSPEAWGLAINPSASYALDRQLHTVCDERIEFASRQDVRETAAASWLFAGFAKFESFGYAMIEALLAGCWVFCGDHLVYRDRPVFWFKSGKEALVDMLDFAQSFDPTSINHEGRQFVIDNYSLDVFREQFMGIVGRCI